jgi:hypothetical protein
MTPGGWLAIDVNDVDVYTKKWWVPRCVMRLFAYPDFISFIRNEEIAAKYRKERERNDPRPRATSKRVDDRGCEADGY